MSSLRSGKRAGAAKEAASLPEAKKPTKLSNVMQRISMMKRKPLGVIDVTYEEELVAVMALEKKKELNESSAAYELAQELGGYRMIVSTKNNQHWLSRALGETSKATFAIPWSGSKAVVGLAFIGELSCFPGKEPIKLDELVGIKEKLSKGMTEHYDKVTHFEAKLTETEFEDLHMKLFEKGVADLKEAKCPVRMRDV